MRKPATITLVLAEDHAVVREGTRQLLECDQRIDVVGEAPDGPTAIELARSLSPDVLLLDVTMPGCSGVEVARAVAAMPHPSRVLVLSAHDDAGYVHAMLAAGASGYLLKTATASEVVCAVVAVAAGEIVLDPAIAPLIFDAASGGDPGTVLTDRETDVLQLAAQGLRTKEIADVLSVGPRTVESHLTSVFNKLGVDGRLEAVVEAAARGILDLPGDHG